MRVTLLMIAVLVVGVLFAADAPKASAGEAKKVPTVETKKVEAAPAAAPAKETKKEEPKKEAAKKEEPKKPVLPESKAYEVKDEVVTDTKTGLMWQRKDAGTSVTHKEAVEYCESLKLGGYDDWRLPSIDELRTLIVGCQSGAEACKVGGDCLSSSCWSPDCACQAGKGPGENGFYWQSGVWQGSGKYFWSASVQSDKKGEKAWDVGFNYGNVYDYDRSQKADVRCVRGVKK